MKVYYVIAYNGLLFHGSQWQPNVPTVTGTFVEILQAMKTDPTRKVRITSRTDLYVSAVMNILRVNQSKFLNLRGLNKLANPKGIAVLGMFTEEPRIKTKRYAYYLQKSKINASWEEIAWKLNEFKRMTEFAAFIKPDKIPRNTMFEVHETMVKETNLGYLVEIEATGFGWQQVRRMIGFIIDPKYKGVSPLKFQERKVPLHLNVPTGKHLLLKSIEFKVPIVFEQVARKKDIELEGLYRYHDIEFQRFFINELVQKIHVMNKIIKGKTSNGNE